ncbi:MAG: hypothetical protein LC797_09385 [Chloroflexi bacterium]|nr:hypothetical protein [Chloroflexota bacterium]
MATVGTVLVVWFGVEAVWSGRLSVGGLVVFLGYLGSLYTSIQSLGRLMGVVQRAREYRQIGSLRCRVDISLPDRQG